jgi:hypothetical protein
MSNVLFRSIDTPIRKALTWEESWTGEDAGLIYCWEKGIEMSFENPELAASAGQGELVKLHWTGGVYKKMVDPKNKNGEIIKENIIEGTHNYLATLQGLRGVDLNIDLDSKITLVCTKYNQKVLFKPKAF